MQNKPKPLVVIDSNVWISGLIFGGNSEEVIRRFIDGRIIAVFAEELISELRRKVLQKFPLFEPNQLLLEALIRENGILIQLGAIHVSASRNTEDNKFIETAVIGSADYLISGDNDLLSLHSYKQIKILNPSDFVEIFQ